MRVEMLKHWLVIVAVTVVLVLAPNAYAQTADWTAVSGVQTTTPDKVGIGTTTTAAQLSVISPGNAESARFDAPQSTTAFVSTYGAATLVNSDATANNFARLNFAGYTGTGASASVAGRLIDHGNLYADLVFWTRGAAGWSEKMAILSDGNVGIGTTPASGNKLHVAGNVKVDGNITATGSVTATYQDVAEWVSAGMALEPGIVVVLDPSHDDQVVPSSTAYDTAVAGVVSANPGVILGIGAAGKEKIATTGRVRVRVDATRAPIKIGDLLVTSDIPGTAMKSQPIDIAGAKIHRPGTVIGKALQALPGGRGEILVLLSLQ